MSDPAKPGQLQLSPFRSFGFDSAVIVLLSATDYAVSRASKVPRCVVESSAIYRQHVNAKILFARPEIMGHPDATDLTATLRAVQNGRQTVLGIAAHEGGLVPLPSPSAGPAHLAHVLLTAGPADQQAWSTSIGRVLPADVTGMRIDAEIVVAAPPGVVWDLLANITNTGNWSPECIRTAWLDGHHDARPGVRFSGRNRALGGFEWTVTCVITQADRPRTLEWVVLDDEDSTQTVDHPSSRWRYDLDPALDGTTFVRHCFVHGPGDSGLRWMMRRHPERSAEIIEYRRQTLQANMRHTLAAMKAAAQDQSC